MADACTRTVGIIEAGLTPDAITRAHGDFPAMIERWLGPALPEARFVTIKLASGATLPKPDACDAYIITGSEAGVYERLPWMAPLKAFILEAAARRTPQFGICFGHQIMAEAFGGRVVKAPQGWQAGLYDFEVHDTGLLPAIATLPALALHQDQVVEPPPAARVIGSHEDNPFAFLQYTREALSTQCHPEFSAATVKAYLDLGNLGVPEALVAASAESMARPHENEVIAAMVARAFRAGWAIQPM
jgi:GMP synthase-like glutamine amidotransferase